MSSKNVSLSTFTCFSLWENKGFCNLFCNSIFFPSTRHLQLQIFIQRECYQNALFQLHQTQIFIWKCIFTKHMFNYVQLMQLRCPPKFPRQITHAIWTNMVFYMAFHSSIDEQNLMSIAINLQLMCYQIIILWLMSFSTYQFVVGTIL
jgi:hypothetical protein